MERPEIVSQAEWLVARKALLAREKELTRLRDALATARRELPVIKVEKDYVFDSLAGPRKLRDLFGAHAQLIVYHFMFDPSWEEGCKSCSNLADSIDGAVLHLRARNTAFTMVSRAPIEKIEAFKKRMGWRFPWVSSNKNSFNYDFHVTLDPEAGSKEYNFEKAATLFNAGKIWYLKGELPGLSVFLREGDAIYHTYSVYQRGLDHLLNTYNLLDMTPLGRQEENDRVQGWIRHHDKYAD
jgi:predicted dithiol-disulfide oxidoreductase (DUF899 family)